MISNIFYELPQKSWWQGRIDGEDPLLLRIHQQVEIRELNALSTIEGKKSVVIIGFASDEGVRRNQGRVGAATGPYALRKALSTLPVHYSQQLQLLDTGNIATINQDLEKAQHYLSEAISLILQSKGFPILLGGGHALLKGHYDGLCKGFKNQKIGIINFDAHFDLREVTKTGPNSGTALNEIAAASRVAGATFHYLAIGIQRSSNSQWLFKEASKVGAQYIEAEQITPLNLPSICQEISHFAQQVDKLYLSIDLDVFSSAIAPGVSAPSAAGIFYDGNFKKLVSACFETKKVSAIDISELNPLFDIDNRTAKLGAQIIFDSLLAIEENL